MTAPPHLSADALKRKLRHLKQLERRLRRQYRPHQPNPRLVWDVFFSTRANRQAGVKYPLERLAALDGPALQAVIDE